MLRKDFDPTAVAVIESKVTTAPAVGQASPVAASPFTGNISSAQQFPSLGSGHAGTQPSAWAQAPASIKEWDERFIGKGREMYTRVSYIHPNEFT